MPVRIRFDVTPGESSESPASRVAAEVLAKSGGMGSGRGERDVSGTEAADVARVCDEINEAFAGAAGARGVKVRFECEAPAEGSPEKSVGSEATAGTPVRDLNGAGARAALLKLLAFSTMANARAKRAEATRILAEEKSWTVASARGGGWSAVEALRGLACVGATPEALVVKVALPNPCSGEVLARGAEVLCAVAAVARDFGVRVEAIGFDEAGQGECEVLALGALKGNAEPVSSFARGAGERLVYLGETPTEIRGSRFLEAVHGVGAGGGAAMDVAAEKRLHQVLRTLITAKVVTAARGVGEGGLMTAVCGMLLGGERVWGARLDLTPLGGARADALIFGESGARAVVEVATERVGTVISEAHMHGVPAALIGEVTGEDVLDLKTRSLATAWETSELRNAWGLGA